MKIKWRHRQHCEWSRQQHVLLYVIKWQMTRFQTLWKTKSFVKVCLKFKLPLWTKGLLIHLSPLWQLPLWHFPQWHNFPVYHTKKTIIHKHKESYKLKSAVNVSQITNKLSTNMCYILHLKTSLSIITTVIKSQSTYRVSTNKIIVQNVIKSKVKPPFLKWAESLPSVLAIKYSVSILPLIKQTNKQTNKTKKKKLLI